MDEECTMYHVCHSCRVMVLCETFKETCPWRRADRYELDPLFAGCLCLDCMSKVMDNIHAAVNEHIDDDDGA
jgi:hypothetical protein